MGFIFKEPDNKPVDPKAVRLRTILLSAPFALMGVLALVLLLHDGLLGGLNRQKAMGLLSAAVVCGGLIALIFGISAKKMALQETARQTEVQDPWLKRKEWADGRIANTSRKAVFLLWIFVGFWCLVSAVISLAVVPQQLHQGNHVALLALIIPVIFLAIVFFAVNTTRAWRRFNRTIFKLAALPAAHGGVLAGEIQVKMKLQPRHGLHLRLSCVRRTITGKSNNRQTSEKILWQDEKWLRADLPQTGLNATGIPVFFKLPGNLPESTPATGDGIHWKLEASAELSGPNFHATFDVPVFKLAEPPAVSDDLTLPYQMSLDEIRRQIRSQIQVNDLPAGGREFIFPAARNPGFASCATAVCLVWTGIIAVLLWKHAPLPLLLALSAIDLLMAAFVLDLWFRRSHVVVNSKGVMVQRAWFAFKNEQRLQAGQIKNIATDVGATAGHAAYHDLKVQARDGKEILLAKNLNNKPETDWLVRQMIAALKTSSEPPAS
jgi:hypothetical protein